VREQRGGDDRCQPESIGAHAAAVAGDTAFLLTERAAPATLSSALLFARRRGAAGIVVFADIGGPMLARLAGYFSVPIEVRAVVGASSEPAVHEPLPVVIPGPSGADELLDRLRGEGLEVVLEDGVWRAELRGLEVARVVRWPRETGGDGELHIEAGVGRFDRDASAAMHQGEDPLSTLRRAVDAVAAQRRAGAASHPLGLMARSRWLRAAAVDDPGLVGAAELTPVQTTFPATSVRETAPAAALGVDADGAAVLVVFATGAGLDLVPVAADTRALHDPGARLRLALPARDLLPTVEELSRALRQPAEVLDVPTEWG
jgi:hypothetical protein